jgi:ferredoxin-type protein NapH
LRSKSEIIFIWAFIPTVIGFYLIYKYPTWFVEESQVTSSFYWFGKSTSFWYNTLYTGIVCYIAGSVVWKGSSPYGKDKSKPLSSYQRNKFISIFLAQFMFFYLIPFYLPYLISGKAFFADAYSPLNKNAYVYVYNGFSSLGGFAYVFVLVPLSVWFFGKRYCSWFCACGNLAETIGVTKWGNRWVKEGTPRSAHSKKLEWLQYAFLGFALIFGLVLFLHGWKIITAPSLVDSLRAFQDLAIDLMFGALIGVGSYPFLGTRIWCRFGCPLAGMMRLHGKFAKSKFKVQANHNCKGLGLCTTQCPMGIDVASYAHKNGQPTLGHFGLEQSPCIGCGGCIDICPVKALSFQKILNPKNERIS